MNLPPPDRDGRRVLFILIVPLMAPNIFGKRFNEVTLFGVDMETWPVVTFIHLTAAATWLGSMVFYAAIVVPFVRHRHPRSEYVVILNDLGMRFRLLAWVCLCSVAVTGVILSDIISGWQAFTTADGHSEKPSSTIAWKMVGGLVIFITAALHDFKLGPKAIAAWSEEPDSEGANKLRRRMTLYGRINLVLAIIVFWLGVSILRT